MGTKTLSFKEVKRRIDINRKTEKDPAGMTKDPTFRFMNVACSMVNVVI